MRGCATLYVNKPLGSITLHSFIIPEEGVVALVVTLHVELLGAVGDFLNHVEHEELLLREVLGGADVDHPIKDVDERVVVLEKRCGTIGTF